MSDFTFSTRQVSACHFETVLTNKEGTRFGIIYISRAPAPNQIIFEGFKKNPKAFFIEVNGIVVTPKKRGRKPKLLKAP